MIWYVCEFDLSEFVQFEDDLCIRLGIRFQHNSYINP